jgi:hypothetical protein
MIVALKAARGKGRGYPSGRPRLTRARSSEIEVPARSKDVASHWCSGEKVLVHDRD